MRGNKVQIWVLIQVYSTNLVVRIGWCDQRVHAIAGKGIACECEYGHGDGDIGDETQTVCTLPVVVYDYYNSYC